MGLKVRNEVFNRFSKNDRGGTLAAILGQKEDIKGKTGTIQMRSGVQLVVMYKCQAACMG